MWASFLEASAGAGEDFVLYHYGSYDSRSFRGWPRSTAATRLLARIEVRSVNVLALIHGHASFRSTAMTSRAWPAAWASAGRPRTLRGCRPSPGGTLGGDRGRSPQADTARLQPGRLLGPSAGRGRSAPSGRTGPQGDAGASTVTSVEDDARRRAPHKFCDPDSSSPSSPTSRNVPTSTTSATAYLPDQPRRPDRPIRRKERRRGPACKVNRVVESGGPSVPPMRLGQLRRAGPPRRLIVRPEAGPRRPQALGDETQGQAVSVPAVRRHMDGRRLPRRQFPQAGRLHKYGWPCAAGPPTPPSCCGRPTKPRSRPSATCSASPSAPAWCRNCVARGRAATG